MDTHFANPGPVKENVAETKPHRWVQPAPETPASRKKDTIAANLTINEIRKAFSDAINRVSYGDEHIALTRRGQTLALIVPPANVPVERITATVSSAEARNNMSDVMNRVHYGKAVLAVSRKSKTLAVLLNPTAYHAMVEAAGLTKPHATLADLKSEPALPKLVVKRKRTPPHPS